MGRQGDVWIVEPGDNLAKIAEQVYGDQRMLAAISDANGGVLVLHTGDRLYLPAKVDNPYISQSQWNRLSGGGSAPPAAAPASTDLPPASSRGQIAALTGDGTLAPTTTPSSVKPLDTAIPSPKASSVKPLGTAVMLDKTPGASPLPIAAPSVTLPSGLSLQPSQIRAAIPQTSNIVPPKQPSIFDFNLSFIEAPRARMPAPSIQVQMPQQQQAAQSAYRNTAQTTYRGGAQPLSRGQIAYLTGSGEKRTDTQTSAAAPSQFAMPSAARTQQLADTFTIAANGQGEYPQILSQTDAMAVAGYFGYGPFDNSFFMWSNGYTWDKTQNMWIYTGVQGVVAPSGGVYNYSPDFITSPSPGYGGRSSGGPTGRVSLPAVVHGSLAWRISTG